MNESSFDYNFMQKSFLLKRVPHYVARKKKSALTESLTSKSSNEKWQILSHGHIGGKIIHQLDAITDHNSYTR
jgi:hypothetical protein